jgi:hypothetical protein
MATNINYTFAYTDGYPRMHMVTTVDGEEISNVIIDVAAQYNELPTEVLQSFSTFLLEQFNTLINSLIENNLNSSRYNEMVDPLRVLCNMKTGCDEVVYNRENPEQNVNPFPPLEGV